MTIVSLQKIVVDMKFPKQAPAVGANGPFYPNFSQAAASQACTFLKNSVCRVHIIIRQMRCETGIFKSFFNLRDLYCTPNLFCLFDHPHTTVTAQSTYLFFLYSLTLNLT